MRKEISFVDLGIGPKETRITASLFLCIMDISGFQTRECHEEFNKGINKCYRLSYK